MAIQWLKNGRYVSSKGTTIIYSCWLDCEDTGITIESRKRHIPHAARPGTWDYTSYFVILGEEELIEKQTLTEAKKYAEALAKEQKIREEVTV